MTDIVFWLWAPTLLLIVVGFGLFLNHRDRMHSGK